MVTPTTGAVVLEPFPFSDIFRVFVFDQHFEMMEISMLR